MGVLAGAANAGGFFLLGGSLGQAPTNKTLPVITGDPTVGGVASTTNGTWAGSPISYAIKWYRDGIAIGGATASTYTFVNADAGATITVGIKGTNSFGTSAESFSGPFGPIGTPPGLSVGLGQLTRSGVRFGTLTVGASISGTNANYFSVDASGNISVASAGQGHLSGTFLFTVNNSTYTDLTITTIANAYHVDSDASFDTAKNLIVAAAATTTDWLIYITEGTNLVSNHTIAVSLAGPTYNFAGAIVDANLNITPNAVISNPSVYDRNAVAAVSGGSLTILCSTYLGATLSGQLFVQSGPVRVTNLDFNKIGPGACNINDSGATFAQGSAVVTNLWDTDGYVIGGPITPGSTGGANVIPTSTTVSSVNAGASTITMSKNATGTATGITITIGAQSVAGNITSGSPIISSASTTSGVIAGQAITAIPWLPSGTVIQSIDVNAKTITLTRSANASGASGLISDRTTASGVINSSQIVVSGTTVSGSRVAWADCVVSSCRLGTWSVSQDPKLINTCVNHTGDRLIVEDCMVDGHWRASYSRSGRLTAIRRNTFQHSGDDPFQSFTNAPTPPGVTQIVIQHSDNLWFNCLETYAWSNSHGDFCQAGSGNEFTDYGLIFLHNTQWTPTNQGYFSTQTILYNPPKMLYGYVANNFIAISSTNGPDVGHAQPNTMVITKNTVLRYNYANPENNHPSALGKGTSNISAGVVIFKGYNQNMTQNVYGDIWDQSAAGGLRYTSDPLSGQFTPADGSGPVYASNNKYISERTANTGAGNSFPEVFVNVTANGTTVMQPADYIDSVIGWSNYRQNIRTDTRAHCLADIQAAFAARPGSIIDGYGFLS